MPAPLPALILLLGACVADPPQGRALDPAPADTGGPPDSDPDTDPGTDTASPEPAAPVISGRVDAGGAPSLPADLRVGLVPVYFGEGPRVGEAVATATPDATGAFTLQPPQSPPPLSHQYQVGEAQPLDTSGATYAVLAYAAPGADTPWAEGSALYGISLAGLLVWLDATAPELGWPAGWSVVDPGLAGTYDGGRCLLDTELPLQWAASAGYPVFSATTEPVVVAGIGAPRPLQLAPAVSGGAAGQRVAALAYQEVFQDIPGIPPAFDVGLDGDGAWRVTLESAPDSAGVLNPAAQLPYSLAVPLRYTDADASGGWSDGDPTDRATLCDTDGARVMVRHTPPPTSWAGIKLLDCQGGRGGWSAVRRTDAGIWSDRLDAAALDALRMDPAACSW